ncbi:DUF6529 family protein [Angustibacter luteus]|uniref:DUF6529 family protein n=1 Tax=Angustibacter luteus TaxID=658456 RepID=A0ABW1JEQ2_9ACTN
MTPGAALAAVLLVGAAVTVVLGVYGRAHGAAGRALFTFGFSGMLQMKTWLATAALVLVVVQVVSASWMWERLPGAGAAPGWVAPLHRWSGSTAFVLTVPVAVHCLWAIGFETTTTRVLLHSVAGCVFYGAYAAKMLGLRLPGLPGWGIPVLGGTVFAVLVLTWLTSALWFFTRSGLPLT